MTSSKTSDVALDDLAASIRRRIDAAGGGIDIELPPREPAREPIDFGWTEEDADRIDETIRARRDRIFGTKDDKK